jgi:guanylate kinase
MSSQRSGHLVILSGPSCVGKSPLERALGRFFPQLRQSLQKLVLFNSRLPRPGEMDGVDYHFRTREQIEALHSDPRYVVLDVRGDLQGLDLEELSALLETSNAFFEGNPFVGRTLQTHSRLEHVKRLSVFLSPLSQEEILYLSSEHNVSLPELVTDVMRRKLLRRTRRQKAELSLKDLEDVEKRASSTYKELKEAWHFQYIIANHDGEDSDNWESFYYPLGDARKALLALAALLEGKVPLNVEKWEEGLVS